MRRFDRASLKSRFLLVFSLSTLGLLTLLGGVSYYLMYSHLQVVQEDNLQRLAYFAADEINHAIEDKQQLLIQVSRAREVKEFSETFRYLPLAKHLSEYQEDFPDISFIDAKGNEELHLVNGSVSDGVVDLSNDVGFQKARKDPGAVIVTRHPTLDALVFTHGMTRYFGDVFLGCLRAVVPLQSVMGHLGETGLGQTGFLILLESDGNLVPLTGTKAGAIKIPERQKAGPEALSHQSGSVVLDDSLGLEAFSAYADIGLLSWRAVAVLPYQEFIAGPRHLTKIFVGFGSLLLLTGCCCALYLGGRLTKPLRRLVAATAEVGGGRWMKIEIGKAPGEVGELILAFNEMTHSLKSTTVSRDYLDNVVESMHESLIVVGLDGKIERVNRATCDLLGYFPDELVGQPVGVVFAELKEASDNWIDQVTRTSGHFSERRYRNKGGDIFPVNFSWARFSDPDGKIHGLICLAQKQDPERRPADWRKRMRQSGDRAAR